MSDTINSSAAARSYHRATARTRLLNCGASELSEVELLALLLPSMGKRSAHDLATSLIVEFGSLRALLTADRDSAAKRGLSEAAFTNLQAALELTRRHYGELMMAGPALTNPRSTREYLRMRLRDLSYEVFAIIYLDNRNRVIKYAELFRGTIDGVTVHPREAHVPASLAVPAFINLARSRAECLRHLVNNYEQPTITCASGSTAS
jgi:DNA repair protein RadC